MRRAGSRPLAKTKGAIALASSPSRTALAKAYCRSRSDSTDLLQPIIRSTRLGDQHAERGDVRVPFDQGRHGAAVLQRKFVELPHGGAYMGRVRVDQDLAAVKAVDRMSRQMDFAHVRGRNAGDEGARIEAVIARAHVYVVDVEQQAAPRFARERNQEVRLGHLRDRELEIARHVLEQHLPAERVLELRYPAREVSKRLGGVRERQQVVEVYAADRAPADMLGDGTRRDAIDQALEPAQVIAVELVNAAERKPNPMQRERVELPETRQVVELCAAISKIVLAVRLEPTHARTFGQQRLVMDGPQADPGGYRDRPRDSDRSGRHGRLRFLRRGAAAHLLAGALRHAHPFLSIVILFRLARAGVTVGRAIVLASLGDAVTLLRVLVVF